MAVLLRRFPLLLLTLLVCSCFPRLAAGQGSTVAPTWDLEKNLQELNQRLVSMRPILEQIDPQKWESAGASSSYAQQKQSMLAEIDAMAGYTAELNKRPENLPLALEILYRCQSIEARAHTLAEGLRRYQNPSLAVLIVSMVAETHPDRDRLFQYSLDFAKQREAEFKVADQEAQRCRAAISKQPR